jgi:uncharacterized protein YbaR (Trm112 family)
MRAFSAAELLNAWEEGSAKTSAERAVELLALVSPETARERLMDLSLGQRDAALLTLRERLFGSRMVAVVVCPDCGERLDLMFDTRQIRAGQRESDRESAEESGAEVAVSVEGYELRLRLANTGDAMAIAGQTDAVENDLDFDRGLLLKRCLLSGNHAGVVIEAEQIPPEVAEIAVQRMATADPMADIELAMTCPSCKRQWSAALDVVSFLWSEIEVWAWRLLHEVHTLASAYGWPERDILRMSANRRQSYLQRVWA